MQLSVKLLFGILVASSATSVLAGAIPDWGQLNNYGTCPDGSPRVSAAAASQAGPLPYCSNYVSTSVSTVTHVGTTTIKGVVTKTECKETDVKTTVVKTKTTTGAPHTVTSIIPTTVTALATYTTTTTLPVVTVTSFHLVRRDHSPPKPTTTTTKCSCIVLFTTTTVSSVKTQTTLSTTTTTVLKSEVKTGTTTITTTIIPTSTITVLTTITQGSTTTTTQTQASTTTTIRNIPSACAGDLTAPPVNLAANTISHPESTYTSIYTGQGVIMPDIISCCAACYNLPGCYSFNFGNFNPQSIPPQQGGSFCQVFVGIDSGVSQPDACTNPEKINYIKFNNPASFGAGAGDFFYAGTGGCSSGIDVSSIG